MGLAAHGKPQLQVSAPQGCHRLVALCLQAGQLTGLTIEAQWPLQLPHSVKSLCIANMLDAGWDPWQPHKKAMHSKLNVP